MARDRVTWYTMGGRMFCIKADSEHGMPRRKIILNPSRLHYLYIVRRLSPYKIAPLLGCSFSTVSKRLREYGIPLRSHAAARMRYAKRSFSGSVTEKAYLLGFSIGDLNVRRATAHGETIVARCHTTQSSQVAVLQRCFERYGHVTISSASYGMQVSAYLDAQSFSFLLQKRSIPGWIRGSARWAFMAGYSDAEGNFIINQGRARMKIDSYDAHVLRWMYECLVHDRFNVRLRCIGRRGFAWRGASPLRNDLWRLNINQAADLKRFIVRTLPFVMHAKRRRDMRRCLTNINRRMHRGTV